MVCQEPGPCHCLLMLGVRVTWWQVLLPTCFAICTTSKAVVQAGALLSADHPRPASRPVSQASRQQQAAAGRRMTSQPVSRGAARSSYARRSLSGNALRVSLQAMQVTKSCHLVPYKCLRLTRSVTITASAHLVSRK